ncbi:helix-turn-helix transcriptional regulator [bacterium]|nr:helix-turn-helix transcriptional regulator [bacterium]
MNTKIFINLGRNIKKYRLKKDLTQDQLAEKINVHQTYIGKLETGKINPSVKRLFLITRALEITFVDLFDFDK